MTSKTTLRKFSKVLESTRAAFGISKAEFARRLKITAPRYQLLVTAEGTPTYDEICKLIALGVSPARIFSEFVEK